MALPLFDDPPVALDNVGAVGTPCWFAFRRGFAEGARDQAASLHYDADEEIDGYYREGFRVGRQFRPLPCMAERSR